MARFFYYTAAQSPLEAEGRTFKFLPVNVHGGRICGVYEAADDTEVAVLLRACARRVGVSEMSEEDAEKAKKKLSNQPTSRASSQSEPPPRPVAPPPLFPVNANAASAGSAKPDNRVPGEITVPKIISMVRVGRANPPRPLVAEGDRLLAGRLNK